jgi:hypothetical protein
VKRYAAVILVLLGVAVFAVGLCVLPGSRGRFEYMIEVADTSPIAESAITPALDGMGAVRVVVMRNPVGDRPGQVLFVPELLRKLRNSDCALGVLPEESTGHGLAGFDSQLERGTISLAGHPVSICAILQPLVPLFDVSLVMDPSPEVQDALSAAGWKGTVSYLLLSESWEERNRLLAELESRPEALPSPGAQILSPAEKPLLSPTGRMRLAAALICAGLLVIALQLRGLSRDEVARRFGRS